MLQSFFFNVCDTDTCGHRSLRQDVGYFVRFVFFVGTYRLAEN